MPDVVAMSSQALTGWFTLAAALSVAALTGFFNWLTRRGDRQATKEQRLADVADRRAERHEADMAHWRDEAADALGRVREFMTDVHPHRVTLNFQPGSEQQVAAELNAKWEALRTPVARLSIGLPSPQARQLADEVVSGLHRSLNWTVWSLHDLANHRPFTEALSKGLEEWTKLDDNVKALREALHDDAADGSP